MKQKILELLKENKETYFSGEALSKHFGVSRTAIWKVIKQLKESGYPIQSVNNRGYRLLETDAPYTEAELRYRMKASIFADHIFYEDSVTSTSDVIKGINLKRPADAIVCLADIQTNGRGRLGRAWQSPSGTGIWMSILVKPQIAPEFAVQLTQVAAVAVVEAIREETGLEAGIKWPNDIIVSSKKVCGILTEMSAEMGAVNYVILGIGVNVSTESFPNDISEVATSLYLESGELFSRVALVERILRKFETEYQMFLNTTTLGHCIERCKGYSVTLGKDISVIQPARTIYARAVSLTEKGELVIEHKDGSRETVFYGEVSVRGMNGYV